MKDNNDFINTVIKAQANDIDALHSILKVIEKDAYSILYCLIGNNTDVSDIVQEVLVKVAKNIKHLKNPSALKQWVNKIVVRQYYNWLKKEKNNSNRFFENDILEIKPVENIKDVKQNPIYDAIKSELNGIIQNSICKLNKPYREAIIMREFGGLSYIEIAKATKTSVGTVKSRIARARSRLREFIEPYI